MLVRETVEVSELHLKLELHATPLLLSRGGIGIAIREPSKIYNWRFGERVVTSLQLTLIPQHESFLARVAA